jgi:hypothetical protein
MTEQEIHEQKQIEFYAAAVNAWLGTSLEHDRSLITLSAGGIGLLITLLSTVGLHSVESLILYIMALIAFTTCLTAVLWIFKRNRAHLEHAIHGDNTVTDPLLTVLDTVAIVSFLFGAVLAATIGVAAAVHSFETREMLMSQDKDRHMANDSINGRDCLIFCVMSHTLSERTRSRYGEERDTELFQGAIGSTVSRS